MSFINSLPIALYRLAANIFLGAGAVYVLCKVLDICIVQNASSLFPQQAMAGWFICLVLLAVLIVFGEITALLGEALINPLFVFPMLKPCNKKSDWELEHVAPCSVHHKLKISTLVKAGRDQGTFSFSEVHFVLSRVLAGTGWLAGLIGIVFLFQKSKMDDQATLFPDHSWIVIFIFLFYLVIPILVLLKCWINNRKKRPNCFLPATSFILSVSVMVGVAFHDKTGSFFSLLVLFLFLLLNAGIYRSFANIFNLALAEEKLGEKDQ